jgi:preprotein translocase subunit SecD
MAAAALAQETTELPDYLRPVAVRRPPGVSRVSLEFRLVVDRPGPGTVELKGPEGTPLILASEILVREGDITKAEVGPALESVEFEPQLKIPFYVVHLHFTPAATERLHRASQANVGHRMAIVIDGRILMAPTLHSTVDSPLLIEARYARGEAVRIAERLAP